VLIEQGVTQQPSLLGCVHIFITEEKAEAGRMTKNHKSKL